MKSTLVLLACVFLCAFTVVLSEEGVVLPPWEDANFYQFGGEFVAAHEGLTDGRIVYLVGEKTLFEQSFSFQLDIDGTATFVVPNPASIRGLAASEAREDVVIQVYVGDALVQSFNLEEFEHYNRALKGTLEQQLRPAFEEAAQSAPVKDEAPSLPDRPSPRAAPLKLGNSWTDALVPSTCELNCLRDYTACLRACNWSCSAYCDQQQMYCLGGCPTYDSDGDGVLNGSDNCIFKPNPNQADCDWDGVGNVCDSLNAIYQVIQPEKTCMTDKDNHVVYFTFEHHVEKRERDVSSCGAPDRWTRRIRMDNDCVNISDYSCCWGLRNSIMAVGDSPDYWCSSAIRDRNFCH